MLLHPKNVKICRNLRIAMQGLVRAILALLTVAIAKNLNQPEPN